nr:excisionase [Streptococcus phage T12]
MFHGWNYNSYKANNNLLEIRHLEDIVKYNTIMRDQYKKGSNEYNAFQQDIEQDKNQIALLFNEHQLLENIDN